MSAKGWLIVAFVLICIAGASVGVYLGNQASSVQRCTKRCENGDPRRNISCRKWCDNGADSIEFPR